MCRRTYYDRRAELREIFLTEGGAPHATAGSSCRGRGRRFSLGDEAHKAVERRGLSVVDYGGDCEMSPLEKVGANWMSW
jgi:hypothetical protein